MPKSRKKGFERFSTLLSNILAFTGCSTKLISLLRRRTKSISLIEHYTASLKRSVDAGETGRFTDQELKAVAWFMMAARSYIYLGYIKYGSGRRRPPEAVIQTYL